MSKKAPLPPLTDLPGRHIEHETLHALVRARMNGASLRDLSEKFGTTPTYIKQVLWHYYERWAET